MSRLRLKFPALLMPAVARLTGANRLGLIPSSMELTLGNSRVSLGLNFTFSQSESKDIRVYWLLADLTLLMRPYSLESVYKTYERFLKALH